MEEQQRIFEVLNRLADGISAMFGRNCEVAVHDLSDVDHSLVHLSGKVTGRNTGAPATDLLIKALAGNPEDLDDIYNYKTTTKDGRSLKSSTMFIRNSDAEVIGAFCINLDTTDFFNAAQALAPFMHSVGSTIESEVHESFSATAEETVESIFEQTLLEIGKQPATMTTPERTQLVALLEEQGVFQMKGAVNRIARLCGVSKFTIYNYLKIIKNQNKSINHNKNKYIEALHEESYPN